MMPLNTDDSRGVVANSTHHLGMDAMTEVRLYIDTNYSYLGGSFAIWVHAWYNYPLESYKAPDNVWYQ